MRSRDGRGIERKHLRDLWAVRSGRKSDKLRQAATEGVSRRNDPHPGPRPLIAIEVLYQLYDPVDVSAELVVVVVIRRAEPVKVRKPVAPGQPHGTAKCNADFVANIALGFERARPGPDLEHRSAAEIPTALEKRRLAGAIRRIDTCQIGVAAELISPTLEDLPSMLSQFLVRARDGTLHRIIGIGSVAFFIPLSAPVVQFIDRLICHGGLDRIGHIILRILVDIRCQNVLAPVRLCNRELPGSQHRRRYCHETKKTRPEIGAHGQYLPNQSIRVGDHNRPTLTMAARAHGGLRAVCRRRTGLKPEVSLLASATRCASWKRDVRRAQGPQKQRRRRARPAHHKKTSIPNGRHHVQRYPHRRRKSCTREELRPHSDCTSDLREARLSISVRNTAGSQRSCLHRAQAASGLKAGPSPG